MKTRFITSPDGIRIAYDVTGQGPVLMLLHSAGKTRKGWHKVGYVERLQQDFTVITVDIRGAGESEFLTDVGDYDIDKICADLYTVADACAAQQFAVWGYSFGGSIARYLGAWSDRVTAMAIIGVPFGPAVDAAFDRYIDEFLDKYGPLAQEYDKSKLTKKQRQSAIKGYFPVWIACFQAMRQWPSIAPADMRCPTLLLVGTKNENVLNWVRSNQGVLDGSQVQVEMIDRLSHPQEFSRIERVYPVVLSFLRSHLGNGGESP